MTSYPQEIILFGAGFAGAHTGGTMIPKGGVLFTRSVPWPVMNVWENPAERIAGTVTACSGWRITIFIIFLHT
jgi:hypothetical protein